MTNSRMSKTVSPTVEEFILQVFEVVITEVEASLEGTRRYPLLAFEEGNNLFQHFVKRHASPSDTSSSATSASVTPYS
jgi:hypothetical protein